MMQSYKCKYLNQLTFTLYFSTARQKTAQKVFFRRQKVGVLFSFDYKKKRNDEKWPSRPILFTAW